MTAAIVSYGLAGSGLALMVAALVLLHVRRVDASAANSVIVKLLHANNLERAQRLCAAAPGTYLDAIGAALAALPASKDRVNVEAAVDGAFDPIARKLEKRWRGQSERGLLGAMLVAGGVALQLTGDTGVVQPLWVAAGLAALGTVWLVSVRRYAVLAISAARSEVLPALVEVATR